METKMIIAAITLSCSAIAMAQTGNTTLGTGAGDSITSGSNNTLIGENAGSAITDDNQNTFVGKDAGILNIANGNTFLGFLSGASNTTGEDNVFIGDEAGRLNVTDNDNTFVGSEAGENNAGGTSNTFIGEESGASNTTGDDNTFVGQDAGGGMLTGRRNTSVGSEALSASGAFDGIGDATGYGNSAFGYQAGYDISSGYHNTMMGLLAGTDLGDGHINTFIGTASGHHTEHADYNTFVGGFSGYENNRLNGTNTANRNTYLGMASGLSNRTGSDNVIIGAFADFRNWEKVDPAVVDAAFVDDSLSPYVAVLSSLNANRTIMIGGYSSVQNDDGMAMGYLAKTSGGRAITIGANASSTHADAITIGYNAASHAANTAVIGNETTTGWHPGADGVTALGDAAYRFTDVHAQRYSAVADTAAAAQIDLWADNGTANDDKWRISAADGGDLTISSFASGAYVAKLTVENSGNVTIPGEISVNSDARLKSDIRDISDALALISRIDGKTYEWKDGLGRDDRRHYGLIAQQVESVIPELVTESQNGTKSVNYQAMVPVLVEAMKDLRQAKDVEIQALSAANDCLAARLSSLEAVIAKTTDN